ncbi:MAG TPA: hypothetical protein VGG75_29665 [Trebonia sp.]
MPDQVPGTPTRYVTRAASRAAERAFFSKSGAVQANSVRPSAPPSAGWT